MESIMYCSSNVFFLKDMKLFHSVIIIKTRQFSIRSYCTLFVSQFCTHFLRMLLHSYSCLLQFCVTMLCILKRQDVYVVEYFYFFLLSNTAIAAHWMKASD